MLVVTLAGETKDVPLGHRAVNRTGPLGPRRTARVRRAVSLLLTRSGFTAHQVAEVLNVDHSTACRLIKAASEAKEDPDPVDLVPIGLGGVSFNPLAVHYASWSGKCQGCNGSIEPGSGQVCLVCHRSDETIAGLSPKPEFGVYPGFRWRDYKELKLTQTEQGDLVLDSLDDLPTLETVIRSGLVPSYAELSAKSQAELRRALKRRRHRRAWALLIGLGWMQPQQRPERDCLPTLQDSHIKTIYE